MPVFPNPQLLCNTVGPQCMPVPEHALYQTHGMVGHTSACLLEGVRGDAAPLIVCVGLRAGTCCEETFLAAKSSGSFTRIELYSLMSLGSADVKQIRVCSTALSPSKLLCFEKKFLGGAIYAFRIISRCATIFSSAPLSLRALKQMISLKGSCCLLDCSGVLSSCSSVQLVHCPAH